MLTIGIDVGITGALATLDEHGVFRFLADLPIATHGKMKWIDGPEFMRILLAARNGGQPARVVVEYMHALPMLADEQNPSPTARGGGIWAASAKGMVLGSVLTVLQINELRFQLIVPQKWKRALGLMMPNATYLEKKQASLDMARRLYPNASLARQRDNGRAEALLIAHFAHRFMPSTDLFDTKAAASA